MDKDIKKDGKIFSRRGFLKALGIGAASTATVAIVGCDGKRTTQTVSEGSQTGPVPTDKMTYRTTPNTGDKVSILGYGCMRLPTLPSQKKEDEKDADLDQEMINRLTDYAIAHGVNYFDTSPAYCKGRSEKAMGIALSRHKRSEYLIATKLSNFSPDSWSRSASEAIYHNSFKQLQVDTIDYMLLHAIGMPAKLDDGTELDGMTVMNRRYFDNGMLDFLVEERKKGKIRNLGFSYHGDIACFDRLLKMQDDGLIRWDFVQIQLNFLDWKHAKEVNTRNTNAEYLYGELQKRNLPAIIMEPLLGGRLSKVADHVIASLKQRSPTDSVASWSFRFAGSLPGVLCVLSGMTYMEHLQDNIRTYSPLKPLTQDDLDFLERTAQQMLQFPTVPCNDCKYCMPCPYGLDIPGIFVHYNKCVNEGNVPRSLQDKDYAKQRRIFLIGYDRSVPKLRQAAHCTACGQCMAHCPQGIQIPDELYKIDRYVETLKQGIQPLDLHGKVD